MTLTATLVGQLYGKRGNQGLSQRVGSGAPTSSTTANDGDTYLDAASGTQYEARSGGTWPSNGQSLIGPKGATGLSGNTVPAVGNYCLFTAPPACSGGTIGLSNGGGTPLGLFAGDSSQTVTMVSGGALAYATIDFVPSGSASATVNLVDSATNAVVVSSTFSSTSAATTNTLVGSTIQTITTTAGQTLQWQLGSGGSGSASITVNATYLMGATVGVGAKSMPAGFLPTTLSPSASGVAMLTAGAGGMVSYAGIPSTGYLSAVVLTNGTTASATFSLVNLTNNSVVYTSPSVAANSETQTFDMATTVCPILPNQIYYWKMIGTGTGSTISHAGWKVVF